jgi:hypothetical protein
VGAVWMVGARPEAQTAIKEVRRPGTAQTKEANSGEENVLKGDAGG